MPGPVESIAQVPLGDLLPGESSASVDQIRRSALKLETHRDAAGHVKWHWYPENARHLFTGDQNIELVLFDAIALLTDGADWQKLRLQVGRRPAGTTVTMEIEAACWHPERHRLDPLRQAKWPEQPDSALQKGFRDGVFALTNYLDNGGADLRNIRGQDGLPGPS